MRRTPRWASSMNGIVNFRRRHPVTRLHLLIIVLAVLAVVTPATAPVNAQETVTQTADGATWTLTGETSVCTREHIYLHDHAVVGDQTNQRIRWIPPAQHRGQSGQAGNRSDRLHLAGTILHLFQRRFYDRRARNLGQRTGTRHSLRFTLRHVAAHAYRHVRRGRRCARWQ